MLQQNSFHVAKQRAGEKKMLKKLDQEEKEKKKLKKEKNLNNKS